MTSRFATLHAPPLLTRQTSGAQIRHPIRRRLWKVGIAAAAVLAVVIGSEVSQRLRDPDPRLSLGHDLIPSYAAGVLVHEGRPRGMYDQAALEVVEFRMMREANLMIDPRFGAWLNPPFYAWVFVPLAQLPYRQAAAVFLTVNLALFVASLVLLGRLLIGRTCPENVAGTAQGLKAGFESTVPRKALANAEPADWRTIGLVPLLVLLAFPFWQVMGHQQNTLISLLLLLVSVACWRAGKGFAAGIVVGLLFFKPQLAAVFATVLVIGMGWRAVAGIAVTGFTLLGITLVTLPGCLSDYFHKLPPILHWLQMELPYNWGRQVTFQSFWRLAIQGQVRGETIFLVKVLWWLSSGVVLMGIGMAAWKYRTGRREPVSRDRLIAAAIAAMPMLMPYYMDYDLLLLAVPAVLLAAEWIAHPAGINRADHWLLGAWALFCVESHFNPAIAGGSRWNPIVPILALISILHILRCFRSTEEGNTGCSRIDGRRERE